MAPPPSQDLRHRLVRAVEHGNSASKAVRRFAVSESGAIKLIRCGRDTGSAAAERIGDYRKPLLAGHKALLRELAASKSGITLAETKRSGPRVASRRLA